MKAAAAVGIFRAYRIHERDRQAEARFDDLTLDDLGKGEVLIRVEHSDINYKDALAATGAGRILRRYPLVGGIDLAGEVVASDVDALRAGDKVLVTGCGLSETHDGGYAEYARVPAEWVIPMPPGLDTFHAMAIGTAGFTAALAIHRMEHNGLAPEKGRVVVTGATGGVGSIAVDMLAARGYEVVAVTGKNDSRDYLQLLGAREIVLRQQLNLGSKPLEATQWAGAIDNVGGDLLTWLTRTMNFWGSIASVGLAGSHELHTTVMPFILRGVNLLGINSSATPRALRLAIWKRIATDLKPRHLDRIVTRTIALEELPTAFDAYLKGGVVGRTVVRIGRQD
jgi:acrylyl-CoA reductase (NADPH)